MAEAAKQVFKPEFLNRFDEIIVFRQLAQADAKRILELELAKVVDRLKAKELHLEIEDGARDFLIEKGFDVQMGARPLKRTVQKYLEDPLAEEILRGELGGGETVIVRAGKDGLKFKQPSLAS
jgi:ATP-dependent Clp protease ATP-binding subunit ClpA